MRYLENGPIIPGPSHGAKDQGEKIMAAPPWQIYYDEFHRLAADVPRHMFDRERAFAEAAHEAYRATANHLSTDENWDDDRTLVLTHAFGQTVKQWIEAGNHDFAELRDRLRARWESWSHPS